MFILVTSAPKPVSRQQEILINKTQAMNTDATLTKQGKGQSKGKSMTDYRDLVL